VNHGLTSRGDECEPGIKNVGQVPQEAVRTHVHQWHTTDGMAFLVADSAFYRAANLQKLAQTPMKWITRVPAILNAGKTVLAQTDPQALASLKAN
jgi:transposase